MPKQKPSAQKTLIVLNRGETGSLPEMYLVDGDYRHLDEMVLDRGTEPVAYAGKPEAELCMMLFGPDGTGDQGIPEVDYNGRISLEDLVSVVIIRCAYVP